MPSDPTPKNVDRMWKFATKYAEKSGTAFHPDREVTLGVIHGLAKNQDEIGRPLCPCRFYADKLQEIKERTWICACDDMKKYKYCHCLLFVRPDGFPVTEYLPDGHEGLEAWGRHDDNAPEKGREGGNRVEG